jgi:hypothetical protein
MEMQEVISFIENYDLDDQDFDCYADPIRVIALFKKVCKEAREEMGF